MTPKPSFVTVLVHAWLPDSGRTASEFFPPDGAGLDAIYLAKDWEQEEEIPDGWTTARIAWEADTPAGAIELIRRFDRWLGWDMSADENGKQVWAGKIWEMTLTAGRLIRQVSLDDVANSVTADYNGGSLLATTNDDSIARFGEIQRHLDLTDLDATAAQNWVDTFLQFYAWPQAKVVELSSRPQAVRLEVVAFSYLQTGLWLTTPTAVVPAGTTISQAIEDLLTADFPHCAVGNIAENTETIDALPAGDPLKALVGLVGLGGTPDTENIRPRYRLSITDFNTINYEIVSREPIAFFLEDGLYPTQTGGVAYTAFNAPLGVIRDEYNPIGSSLRLSWLLDSRDALITRKVARQGDEEPGYSSADISNAKLKALAASPASSPTAGDDSGGLWRGNPELKNAEYLV